MKYSVTKLINNELIVVTVELNDTCNNGYDEFSLSQDVYSRNGKRNEPKKKYGKYTYYLDGFGGCDKDLIERHFSELLPFYGLHCDRFGMPSYPIMNTLYYLNNEEEFKFGCEYIGVTEEIGHEIKKYNNFHFGEFLKNHIEEVRKPKIDEAIKLLEKLTNCKYVEKTKISPQLFNDLHYTLISDKKGWNVFKENPKSNYNEIFDLKDLSDV